MCIRDSPNVIDLAFEFAEKVNRETNNKIIIFFILSPINLIILNNSLSKKTCAC